MPPCVIAMVAFDFKCRAIGSIDRSCLATTRCECPMQQVWTRYPPSAIALANPTLPQICVNLRNLCYFLFIRLWQRPRGIVPQFGPRYDGPAILRGVGSRA